MMSRGHKYTKSAALMACSAILLALVEGCATVRPDALDRKKDSVDLSEESIALFTLKIANTYKPKYQPEVEYVFVWEDAEKDVEKYSFTIDETLNEVEGEFTEYLVGFQLPPGEYILREIMAVSGPALLRGFFGVPLFSSFRIDPEEIIYLGHIDARVKEKTSKEEMRAGPTIPLIPQSVIGASGGTFVIEITDEYEADIQQITREYPNLANYSVVNKTLPPWKNPRLKDSEDEE